VLEIDPGDTIRARTLRGSWDDAGFDLNSPSDATRALGPDLGGRLSEPGK